MSTEYETRLMIGGRLHEVKEAMGFTGSCYDLAEALEGRGLEVVGDYDEEGFVGAEIEGKVYLNIHSAQKIGKLAKPFREITGMQPYVCAVLFSY